MKTFKKEDVFSWANYEEAKAYIGKKGYFADSLAALEQAVKGDYKTYTLVKIFTDGDVSNVFSTDMQRNYGTVSGLFLPADRIVEVKKFRPFKNVNEVAKTLGLQHILGSEVTYRNKDEPFGIARAIITRTYENTAGAFRITFGDWRVDADSLFKNFEWLDKHNEWQPFGVQEE